MRELCFSSLLSPCHLTIYLSLFPPPSPRQALLAAEIQKTQALSAHLQRTQAFSFMHTMSPATPLIMAIVNATTNRMSLAVNTPYGKHFHTSSEMVRDLFEHKVRLSCPSPPPFLPPSLSLLNHAPS